MPLNNNLLAFLVSYFLYEITESKNDKDFEKTIEIFDRVEEPFIFSNEDEQEGFIELMFKEGFKGWNYNFKLFNESIFYECFENTSCNTLYTILHTFYDGFFDNETIMLQPFSLVSWTFLVPKDKLWDDEYLIVLPFYNIYIVLLLIIYTIYKIGLIYAKYKLKYKSKLLDVIDDIVFSLFGTYYLTALTNYLTNPVIYESINSAQDMLDKKMKLIINYYLLDFLQTSTDPTLRNLGFLSDGTMKEEDELTKYAFYVSINYGKRSYFFIHNSFKHYLNKTKLLPGNHIIGPYYFGWVVKRNGINKAYRKALDIQIERLWQYGFIQQWLSLTMSNHSQFLLVNNDTHSFVTTKQGDGAFNIKKLAGAFYLLFFGNILGIIVFIIERLY